MSITTYRTTLQPPTVRNGFAGVSHFEMEQMVYNYIATAPRGVALLDGKWITHALGGMGKEDVKRVWATLMRLKLYRCSIWMDPDLGAWQTRDPYEPYPERGIKPWKPKVFGRKSKQPPRERRLDAASLVLKRPEEKT